MRDEIIDFDFVFTRFVIIEKFQDNKSHLTPNFNRNGEIELLKLHGWGRGRVFISPGIYSNTIEMDVDIELVPVVQSLNLNTVINKTEVVEYA